MNKPSLELIASPLSFAGRAASRAAAVRQRIDLAFRRPIARSLASVAAVGAHYPARVGWVEAAVAVCVFAVCVGLAARNLDLPIRFDEAKTITRFVAKPVWTILSDYSDPNNHILSSLLVWSAQQLLGTHPAALRAPAFLAACLTLPAMWWFVRREYGWLAAAFATALAGTSPFFIEFATNARGYTLLALLFMVTLLCGQGLVRRPDDHVRWGLFAAATALGFFTIPIMAFPVAVAAVWMLLVRWREQGIAGIRPFAVNGALWCAAAVALTALLYAPVLIVSGVDALFFIEAVQRNKVGYSTLPINLLQKWGRWHAATPVWAQTMLLLALAVGAMAPRLPLRHRGLLALAVVSGTAAVLLAKPVWLRDRFTIFLLLATMMVAGAGLAFLSEATFARFRLSAGVVGRWARLEGFGALAVVLVLRLLLVGDAARSGGAFRLEDGVVAECLRAGGCRRWRRITRRLRFHGVLDVTPRRVPSSEARARRTQGPRGSRGRVRPVQHRPPWAAHRSVAGRRGRVARALLSGGGRGGLPQRGPPPAEADTRVPTAVFLGRSARARNDHEPARREGLAIAAPADRSAWSRGAVHDERPARRPSVAAVSRYVFGLRITRFYGRRVPSDRNAPASSIS